MWLLPTLNRISRLQEFLNAAAETKTSTPIVVLVDRADWAANGEEYGRLKRLGIKDYAFFITKGISMAAKCAEYMESEAFKQGVGSWVGILNDDHVPRTEKWDLKLIDWLDGKNFISANDRWMAPVKATTATVWSKGLLDCVGWSIFPPGLQHLFIDDVWEQLGKNTGCWRIRMDVVVEHNHVIKNPALTDDTHNRVYNQKAWDSDKAVFDNFMKHDFAETVRKIKVFQDNLPGQAYNPSPSREANV